MLLFILITIPILINTSAIENSNSSVLTFKCVDDKSCSGFGKCYPASDNNCRCDPGHISFPLDSDPQCNYTQKRQLVAFLCELFLGFGAGHFYTERYNMAVAKLCCFLFGIYIICLFPLTTKWVNDRCQNDCMVINVACFYYYCVLGLAVWFIYDLVKFGSNEYLDGNGAVLQPW